MKDPLASLGDLPNWPGNTPPRNRSANPKPRVTQDELNGARPKIYRIKGVDREFYTVGEVARALHRQPVTLRMWEQRGWLPKVKYRTPPPAGEQIPGKTPKGRRLYSKDQLVFLVEAVQRFHLDDQRKANWVGFRQHIRANWPAE